MMAIELAQALDRVPLNAHSKVYYIGGASAAGKSISAKRLSKKYDIISLPLDDILVSARKFVQNGKFFNKRRLFDLVESQAFLFAEYLLRARAFCIIEGGWIQPREAAKLAERFQDQFCPVYCGYCLEQENLGERYQHILRQRSHWLCWENRKEAMPWLRQQAQESVSYQSESIEYGFPFFDFSDFTKGAQKLDSHFELWINSI